MVCYTIPCCYEPHYRLRYSFYDHVVLVPPTYKRCYIRRAEIIRMFYRYLNTANDVFEYHYSNILVFEYHYFNIA